MTEIQMISPDKLTPYENNSNQHSKSQIAGIAKSIEEFGFNSPIVVNEKMQIKAGHGRWEAAKLLGLKEVPVIRREGLSESQWRAYVIADNKLTRNSTWDDDMLNKEMSALLDDGYDLSITAFSGQEINELLLNDIEPEHKGNPDRVPDIKPEADPVSKPGQIWKLGQHRLMCGDSTDLEDVERLMGGDTAQMLWIETPFNVDGDANKGKAIEADTLSNEMYISYIVGMLGNARAAMDKGASFYVAHQPWHGRSILEALKRCEFINKQQLVCILEKCAAGRQDYRWQHDLIAYGWKPGAKHCWNGILDYPTVIESESKPLEKMSKKELIAIIQSQGQAMTAVKVPTGHKIGKYRSKPITLIQNHIENSSIPNDVVIDFAAGTGATLIAAEIALRRCYAMEYDPVMVDIILQRYREYTREEPVLLCG